MKYRFTFHKEGYLSVRRPAVHFNQVRSIGAAAMHAPGDRGDREVAITKAIEAADKASENWQIAASKRKTEETQ